MVTTTPRLDTPARWTAALDRAHRNHIQVFADRVTGQHFALSSDATKLYALDYTTCSCAAGTGSDPVCQHRALYREMVRAEDTLVAEIVAGESTPALPRHLADLNVIAGEDGEPESSDLLEPTEREHTCTDCLGGGWSRMYLSGHLNDYVEHPCSCTAGRAIRASRQLVAA